MAKGRYVSYLRVSTDRQGRLDLGLEAQRKAVEDFLNGGRWDLIAEFVEVESGKRDDRPKLAKALALCRLHNATLVIAKLDRLSRDAAFLLGLQKAGVRFVAADMPEANELVVGIMAVVAQTERKMISVRTKAALAAARARGVRLGRPENLRSQVLVCAHPLRSASRLPVGYGPVTKRAPSGWRRGSVRSKTQARREIEESAGHRLNARWLSYQVSMIGTYRSEEGSAAPSWRTPGSPAMGSPYRD